MTFSGSSTDDEDGEGTIMLGRDIPTGSDDETLAARARDRHRGRAVRRLVLAGTLPLLLVGCGSTTWTGGAGNAAQFERDAAECDYASQFVPRTPQGTVAYSTPGGAIYAPADGTHGLADLLRRQRTFESCLEAKGYRRQ